MTRAEAQELRDELAALNKKVEALTAAMLQLAVNYPSSPGYVYPYPYPVRDPWTPPPYISWTNTANTAAGAIVSPAVAAYV